MTQTPKQRILTMKELNELFAIVTDDKERNPFQLAIMKGKCELIPIAITMAKKFLEAQKVVEAANTYIEYFRTLKIWDHEGRHKTLHSMYEQTLEEYEEVSK